MHLRSCILFFLTRRALFYRGLFLNIIQTIKKVNKDKFYKDLILGKSIRGP